MPTILSSKGGLCSSLSPSFLHELLVRLYSLHALHPKDSLRFGGSRVNTSFRDRSSRSGWTITRSALNPATSTWERWRCSSLTFPWRKRWDNSLHTSGAAPYLPCLGPPGQQPASLAAAEILLSFTADGWRTLSALAATFRSSSRAVPSSASPSLHLKHG